MKTFKKTYLPTEIEYNGRIYKYNSYVSAGMNANGTLPSAIAHELGKQDRYAVLVLVMPKSLRGMTDLHNKPYEPTKHIFTTDASAHGTIEYRGYKIRVFKDREFQLLVNNRPFGGRYSNLNVLMTDIDVRIRAEGRKK